MAKQSLFAPGITPNVKIEVEMSDPKRAARLKDTPLGVSRSGLSSHNVHLLDNDVYKRLSLGNEILYRLNRMRFIDELSFNTGAPGVSEISFRILDASDWIFDKVPFTFKKEGVTDAELAKIIQFKPGLTNPKEAVIRVNGDKNDFNSEIKYTLHYLENNIPHAHDPRILNGHGVPILPISIAGNDAQTQTLPESRTDPLEGVTRDDLRFLLHELTVVLNESP